MYGCAKRKQNPYLLIKQLYTKRRLFLVKQDRKLRKNKKEEKIKMKEYIYLMLGIATIVILGLIVWSYLPKYPKVI